MVLQVDLFDQLAVAVDRRQVGLRPGHLIPESVKLADHVAHQRSGALKPTAKPAIPAPVSTRVMLTPNSSSTMSTARAVTEIVETLLMSDPRVRARLPRAQGVECRSLAYFVFEASHEQSRRAQMSA